MAACRFPGRRCYGLSAGEWTTRRLLATTQPARRWCSSVLEVQLLIEPTGFEARVGSEVFPALRPGENAAESDGKNIAKLVHFALIAARIIKMIRMSREADLRHP